MRRYMTGLFKLAHDPSSAARKGVCTGLVQLLHLQPDRLAPHLPDIIEYMLRSMQARPTAHRSSCVGKHLHTCHQWGSAQSVRETRTAPELLSAGLVRILCSTASWVAWRARWAGPL